MWDYTEKVKDHFENPRNVGETSRIDGDGQVGSLSCGDALRLTLQIDKAQDVIEDAKFQTFGCASAIAASSALTEMIIGKKIEEALKITNQDIANFLGGLPKAKMHCSVLGREALEAAVANYRGVPLPKVEGNLVCECFGVTDIEIEKVVKENKLTTVEEITQYTKAGGGCGRCLDDIEKLLNKILTGQDGNAKKDEPKTMVQEKATLSDFQKMKLIEEVITKQVAPSLRLDGGDIELVDIDGDTVWVTLKGNCATCPSSKRTLSDFVSQQLREYVAESIVVKEVKA